MIRRSPVPGSSLDRGLASARAPMLMDIPEDVRKRRRSRKLAGGYCRLPVN